MFRTSSYVLPSIHEPFLLDLSHNQFQCTILEDDAIYKASFTWVLKSYSWMLTGDRYYDAKGKKWRKRYVRSSVTTDQSGKALVRFEVIYPDLDLDMPGAPGPSSSVDSDPYQPKRKTKDRRPSTSNSFVQPKAAPKLVLRLLKWVVPPDGYDSEDHEGSGGMKAIQREGELIKKIYFTTEGGEGGIGREEGEGLNGGDEDASSVGEEDGEEVKIEKGGNEDRYRLKTLMVKPEHHFRPASVKKLEDAFWEARAGRR